MSQGHHPLYSVTATYSWLATEGKGAAHTVQIEDCI